MKVGIMQPYFFPYLGYWQLMNAVDKYVVYDDVNFINRGRINRNAILIQNSAHNINLILNGASQNKLINEITISDDPKNISKLLRTIEMAYAKAPYFSQIMPLIEDVVRCTETNLALYLYHTFEIIGEYLGIRTNLIFSSSIEKDCTLKKEKKIIQICKILGGSEYYNSISGIPLYEPHRAEFEQNGIELSFPKMRDVRYRQYKEEFIPNLSIIDVMMFNSQEECQRLLGEYDLLKGSDVEL